MRSEFDPQALEDLRQRVETDRRQALYHPADRTYAAISLHRSGKPEPLKFLLSGCWSRRIDREHRLVYKVENETLIVFACRYYYRVALGRSGHLDPISATIRAGTA
jgi:toxin YoeB